MLKLSTYVDELHRCGGRAVALVLLLAMLPRPHRPTVLPAPASHSHCHAYLPTWLLIPSYARTCAHACRHGGVISEFVNPKYADATKTAFKSSTRLECMMQV